jgi:hypothetical protein
MSSRRDREEEPNASTAPGVPPAPEAEDTAALVEQARQAVKPIIKRELEGEIVEDEILNFRLRSRK